MVVGLGGSIRVRRYHVLAQQRISLRGEKTVRREGVELGSENLFSLRELRQCQIKIILLEGILMDEGQEWEIGNELPSESGIEAHSAWYLLFSSSLAEGRRAGLTSSKSWI
jgi:hypothetical protein